MITMNQADVPIITNKANDTESLNHKDLSKILEVVKSHVEADGYFLYRKDENNLIFKLECVLIKEESIKRPLKIGYGRLLPYGRKEYDPPLLLPVENKASYSLLKDAGNRIYHIPIANNSGIIRILNARKRNIVEKPFFQFMLRSLSDEFKDILNVQVHKDHFDMIKNEEAMFAFSSSDENCMQLIRLISQSDAVIFFCIVNQYCDRMWLSGFEENTKSRLMKIDNPAAIIDSITDQDFYVVDFQSKKFEIIPLCLRIVYSTFVLIRCESGILVLCYKDSLKPSAVRDYRIRFMKLLTVKLSEDRILNKGKYRKLYYQRKLLEIVRLMEELLPKTAVKSEFMRKYTAMLCKESNVDEKTVILYELAASLCNIGYIAMSEESWNKEEITPKDRLLSRQHHTVYGARIIHALLEDRIIEESIYSQYERPDGKGYPGKLIGEDIPEGARILGVVLFYINLLNKDIDRKPVPLEEIKRELKKQSGILIDSTWAQALLKRLE